LAFIALLEKKQSDLKRTEGCNLKFRAAALFFTKNHVENEPLQTHNNPPISLATAACWATNAPPEISTGREPVFLYLDE
jgi:hypothetical protein